MDFINSNNIQSLSYCDLNTKFNDRCYMDWSKTNLLSIVTMEGIYILEPHLERPHGPFKIELIRNPTKIFRHQITGNDDCKGILTSEMLATLNNKQYMEIFLDSALSTGIGRLHANDSNESCGSRRFRLAKWSPVIDKYPKECLLAIITVDYQLLIYGRRDGVWVERVDLSQDYDRLWSLFNLNNIKDHNNQSVEYELARNNLHAVSFCNICWDDRKLRNDQSRTSLNLIAATMHGDIVIWQLRHSRQRYDEDGPIVDEVQCEIKMILKTGQSNVSCMKLHNGLLIASSRNGQVALYDLNLNLESIDTGSNPEIQNATNPANQTNRRQLKNSSKQIATHRHAKIKCVPVIDLPPTAILWHPDNIEVMDFYLQAMDQETSRIVLAKSTNICWCMIQYIKRSNTNPATLIIGDSFSAIDGLDPEISLHQTPATWLKPVNGKRAILIADDGSFFLLDFFDDRQDVSPSFNSILTGKLDLTDMIPRGVCASPNGYLISMISSVTFMYDPIKLTAPSKLITLPSQNNRDFPTNCLQNLLDEDWLQAQNIRSPMDVCDLIDYLRSLFPSLNHKQCEKLSSMLKSNLYELGELRTEIQYVKLKIIGFMELKLRSYLKSGTKLYDNDSISYDQDLEKTVYTVILYKEIEDVLTLLKESDNTTISYSVDQINSLQNYLTWMDQNCLNQNVGQYYQLRCSIRDQLKVQFNSISEKVQNHDNTHELCSICNTEILFDSPLHAQCKNQHRFVRCSRSLLTIDLRKDDELECDHCKRHYIVDRLWPTKNLWPCLYCH